MPSKKDFRRWGASGGRAAYSSISDPEAAAAARRERSRKANEARAIKYPPQGRRHRPGSYIPDIRNFDAISLPIPDDAFRASASDGEWETLEGDE